MSRFVSRKLTEFRSWVRAMFHRSHLESEMEAELANHIECLTADLIRQGHSASEAARRARVAFGPGPVHKEGMRAALGLRWWDQTAMDLRYGLRLLAKSPAFTAVSVLSLALAIGANTTIFSAGKHVLYQSLDAPHPEQLRLVEWKGDRKVAVHEFWGSTESDENGNTVSPDFSYPVYEQMRAQNSRMEDLFAFKSDAMNATVHGDALRAQVEMVSGNYYAQLGVAPQMGRAILPSDDQPGANGSVAVISDRLWAHEFDRSPAAIGQTIKVSGVSLTIVGVNPRGFTGVASALSSPDLFIPLALQPLVHPMDGPFGSPDLHGNSEMWWLGVMARVKPGVQDSVATASLNAALAAAVRGTMHLDAGDTVPSIVLSPGARGLHSSDWVFKKPMKVLMAMVLLVLLLACVNIANLLMARGTQRQREMSVRLAVGAGRGRLLRQSLTESLMLAAMGGAGGLVLGFLARNAVPALLDGGWNESGANVAFDWKAFAFTALVTVVTGLVFGALPAWIASRSELSSSIKESGHTATNRRQNRLSKAIVALQIALSTLLVVGAGLFLRTLFALNSNQVGFDTDHLMLFDINLPKARYPDSKAGAFLLQVEQSVAAMHGVDSVAPMGLPYLSGAMQNRTFLAEGEKIDASKDQAEFVNVVGNNFVRTLEIPLLAGRTFGPQDTETSQKVAIINQSLARKRFPGVNPVGKRFKAGDVKGSDWIQVVGICGDTRYATVRDDPPPQFLLPYVQQKDARRMTFAVRTRMSEGEILPAVRRVVQSLDRDVPVVNARTQNQQIAETLQTERTFAFLMSSFGALALALACVGIYGVMAYAVAQRTNEIGIRLALGAQPAQVRSMILRESTWLALAGIAVGLAGAIALTRLVSSMLWGVKPNDPATYACGIALLLIVALGSSWIPARRAAGVQPMDALRHE